LPPEPSRGSRHEGGSSVVATIDWDAVSKTRGFGVNSSDRRELRAPSKLLWLAEYRSLWELGFSLAASPLLMTAPRGDGHPVLVLPGFLASDLSTEGLRNYLRLLGYDAHKWNLGRNLGGVARMRGNLRARLVEIRERTGRTVSLVGWSLGGIYARLLALDMPETVRSVITLGSPFSRDPRASNVFDIYEAFTGEGPSAEERAAGALFPHEFDSVAGDIPAPSTSIYTKLDGVVSWRSCLLRTNERTENIEVIGASHVGLGVNAAVLWATADRLAQPEGRFAPFSLGGPFSLAYGRNGS
jgi:pimeloyl-ACP methyl ester carboxylesterase